MHAGSPIDEAGQDAFAELLAAPAANPTFTPTDQYRLKLCKLFVSTVERQGGDLCSDSLSELMMGLVSSASKVDPDDPDLTCYQSFTSPALRGTLGCRVALRHNDVGMRMWEAGYLLADFIIRYPELVRGRRVVELGAGCGLTGLVAAAIGGCESMLLTDYTDVTLANMKHNVEVNNGWLRACGVDPAKVQVGFLDWGHVLAAPPSAPSVSPSSTSATSIAGLLSADVLIAGDCVYDRSVIPALVFTVRRLLEAVNGAVAYFATTMTLQ
ncbi:hypothetical protein TeGR_g790 [Tetraparma gracilis]|uniref:Uncharacterized protein n=1 Tax=Tetraparma gracilis TaxID=2962635 RepID=A0ABQ6MIP8_9STRA|nr:hypothetical protein TeGR_g790 [Tetraparma gracilis]